MRITAVSYLNTKPFIYGIFRSALAEHIELSLDIPSVCAAKLLSGEADLALTPVAIILNYRKRIWFPTTVSVPLGK